MRSILNTRRDFIRKASAGIAAISLPSILYAGVAICYKSMFKSASSRKIIAKMPFSKCAGQHLFVFSKQIEMTLV